MYIRLYKITYNILISINSQRTGNQTIYSITDAKNSMIHTKKTPRMRGATQISWESSKYFLKNITHPCRRIFTDFLFLQRNGVKQTVQRALGNIQG